MKLLKKFKEKELVVFDLDGTLVRSKSTMDKEMVSLLLRLLEKKRVAVISGGKLEQFDRSLLQPLGIHPDVLQNLFLFPTTSTSFYRYRGNWKKVYAHSLTRAEKKEIYKAFLHAFRKTKYIHPKEIYGKIIEDRGTQLTFSALGQDVVMVLGEKGLRLKEEWYAKDPRPEIMRAMKPLLLGFEVKSGGLTSIDVTRKGIDKAYGVRQIRDHLKVPVKNMLFLGDAMSPGGNDYAALKTGIDHIKVAGPEDTKKAIRYILSSSNR